MIVTDAKKRTYRQNARQATPPNSPPNGPKRAQKRTEHACSCRWPGAKPANLLLKWSRTVGGPGSSARVTGIMAFGEQVEPLQPY
jgi:hypothetical protein